MWTGVVVHFNHDPSLLENITTYYVNKMKKVTILHTNIYNDIEEI